MTPEEKPKVFVRFFASEKPELGLDPLAQNILSDEFELVNGAMLNENPELLDQIEGAVSIRPWEPRQTQILKGARNLKIVCALGARVDQIDFKFCKSRGIKVGYTPDAVSKAMADMAFGLLLATVRGFGKGMSVWFKALKTNSIYNGYFYQ